MTEESQLNGCYASHIIIHSGTHVAKIPGHVRDNMAATINCALATMVNVVSGLTGENPHRDTVALIQVSNYEIWQACNAKLTFVKSLKADVFSVSPSSFAPREGLTLEMSALKLSKKF